MKGQRYMSDDKIRTLRGADRGEQSVPEICRAVHVSEATIPRWKKPFGHVDVNEAWRLKELERENTEIKKMLAEEMLKNRVFSF